MACDYDTHFGIDLFGYDDRSVWITTLLFGFYRALEMDILLTLFTVISIHGHYYIYEQVIISQHTYLGGGSRSLDSPS